MEWYRTMRRRFLGWLPWRRASATKPIGIYPQSPPGAPNAPVRDADGLPPPPRFLLAHREACELPLLHRRVRSDGDSPRDCLYRIYEHLVLDQHIEIRNELEAFWYHGSAWPVRAIPDPEDRDPERYACLAGIPRLLRLAFNERIRLGLPRDAPPIFTGSMLDAWRARPPVFEEDPPWVARVPPLAETLAIPHWDNSVRAFVPLPGFHDKRASKEFADKNILIWQPHIHFL
ncbi:hypothetical protein SPI_05809 [Niveomyces insectorum RCEF 264]|uniref:Uncharacterized protein n=1 Tax=Niveomyces insectorum RCEF 264 TaxID=1081102 RepID=A0A167SGQ7_9HYPO|nr:hypothetical protein SPI_05809 [Niveomyces insectorum RCEF 264]